MLEWEDNKAGLPSIILSPDALSYNVRKRDGTWPEDSGSTMTDGIWTLHQDGVCPESDMPYNSTNNAVVPWTQAIADQPNHKVIDMFGIPEKPTLLTCLSRKAIVIGIQIMDNFPCINGNPDDGTGQVPPLTQSQNILGGQGVGLYGYSLFGGDIYTVDGVTVTIPYPHLIMKNSWRICGHRGWFYLPMDFSDPQGQFASEPIMMVKVKDVS